MGCVPPAAKRGPKDQIITAGTSSARPDMKPGHVTDRITSEERSVRTARIIRNVSIFTRYDFSQAKMLGTGISGEVVEAVSKLSGRRVAVKTLCTQNLSGRRLEMLLNEVEIYLRLDHPNICKLLEVYEDNSAIRLVMELCTGRELYERLSDKKRYSERDAAQVTRQMLEAIAYCHSHQICHRDLKLENFVYADASADANLKLIDFGFSKLYNPGMPMTAMHGTIYYVAPEVLEGSYDQECDVWSIGVIVYMLLSGLPPFAAQMDHEIIAKIRRAEVSFESSRWSGISIGAKDFVRYLLEKDPKIRPSAKEAAKHPWMKSMLSSSSVKSVASLKVQGSAASLANGATRSGSGTISTPPSIEEEDEPIIDVNVLDNMRKFAKSNAMKRAALGLIAFSLAPGEMENLEKEFRAIDTEGNGTITISQLTLVLTKMLRMSETEATAVFNSIDQTGNNEIHYTEFLAASLQAKLARHEKYVREAFQRFDLQGSGFISLENLRDVLGDSYHGIDVAEILKEVDYKHTGKIDYEEFMRAVVFDGKDPQDEAAIERKKSKTYLRRTLLAQAEKQESLAEGQEGLAAFTWGSCRKDARYKFNPKVLEDIDDFSKHNK